MHLLAHQHCVKQLGIVQNAARLVCVLAGVGEECFASLLSSGEALGEGVLSPTPSLHPTPKPSFFFFLWFGWDLFVWVFVVDFLLLLLICWVGGWFFFGRLVQCMHFK